MKTMAKRFIACLCVISMMFSMMIVAQAAGMELSIDTKTFVQANEEETVEVPITLSGNTGILGMTLQVSHTEGLTLTNVAGGTALKSLTFTAPGDFSANPFNLVWDGMASADTTNGVIATLTFKVSKSTVKDYEINVSLDSGFDGNLDDISIASTRGLISVTEKPKENFTGLSIADATYTYDGTEKALAVSGVPAGATVTYTSADFDADGKAIDVETIYNGDESTKTTDAYYAGIFSSPSDLENFIQETRIFDKMMKHKAFETNGKFKYEERNFTFKIEYDDIVASFSSVERDENGNHILLQYCKDEKEAARLREM